MGYLVNLVMFGGKPLDLVTRNIRRWDCPVLGSVTYAMIPWKLDTNSLDTNHKVLTVKTGTISPHPTHASKCIMTTLETNSMGGMPNWALHFMMRSFAPSLMKGLESRYTAFLKGSKDSVGDFRDLTKFKRHPHILAESKDSDEGTADHKDFKEHCRK